MSNAKSIYDRMREADYLVDIGPGPGDQGGRVVACGTPVRLKASVMR